MKNRKIWLRLAWGLVSFLLVTVFIMGLVIYKRFYSINLAGVNDKSEYLYIPTGARFEDVVQILKKQNLLLDEKSFRWTAHQLKYEKNIRPGKYKLQAQMSNRDLLNLLRSGKQVPVNVIFNNIRTKEQLASRVSEQIEATAAGILALMNDSTYTGALGFSTQGIMAMFIPDTYEFYWNTPADKFMQRMKKEYDRFWTSSRTSRANAIGFTPLQVSVLASIVQMETNQEDEKPAIAGVYINRYRKGWKLEADPTLVFALGDFSIKRVLKIYKEIESPYNTYKNKGLPPGPICLPTRASINAVLNYTEHKYMYFCARDDFSGYHTFSKTYLQHLINARRFQKALDRRGIRS
jgi:UPF0755 protein